LDEQNPAAGDAPVSTATAAAGRVPAAGSTDVGCAAAAVSAPAGSPTAAGAIQSGNLALVKLYWHLSMTGIITFAGFAIALLVAKFEGYSDLMLLVLLAGSTGAVINNYYRLAKLSTADRATLDALDNNVFTVQLYVSVLISGVLGFVMYGLCLSGLISGGLFPAFKGVKDGFGSVPALLREVSPESNLDAVKALVWAFIAGFSEKLIPNVIDRVADRAIAMRDDRD
jgi:hypothetical protein